MIDHLLDHRMPSVFDRQFTTVIQLRPHILVFLRHISEGGDHIQRGDCPRCPLNPVNLCKNMVPHMTE